MTRCTCCGAVENLTERRYYVGGQGYSWFVECADKPACWKRQDDAELAQRIEAMFVSREIAAAVMVA